MKSTTNDGSLTVTLSRGEAAVLARLLAKTQPTELAAAVKACSDKYGIKPTDADAQAVFELFWDADDCALGNRTAIEDSDDRRMANREVGAVIATTLAAVS